MESDSEEDNPGGMKGQASASLDSMDSFNSSGSSSSVWDSNSSQVFKSRQESFLQPP
jgi:hypothetical protein